MGRGEPGDVQGLDRGLGVSSATFRPPDQPSRESPLACGPLLPPGGRGAGVSRKAERAEAAALRPGGAPQGGRARGWAVRPRSPSRCRARRARSLVSAGRPLPAGGARLALIGAAGRGRRELARSSVSIRDAKFLLGRRRRQAQCLGEQERWEVLEIGSTTVLGPLWVFTLVRPLARHAPCLSLLPGRQGDAHLYVSAFSAASGLPDANMWLAVCVCRSPLLPRQAELTSPAAPSALARWLGRSRQVLERL